MELLDYYGFDPAGKNVVVIGRSLVIGRPVSMMLQSRNATVTMCHTKTVGMADICRKADILIVAAGKAKVVDENYVNPNQVVIDVGINVDENGKLCGDVNFDRVMPNVKAISPVPGGVGTVTTAVLCKHVIEAAEKI
jgi:methylenetetrahydrofolate dehydrogenase (NADP+)/methenyltetrahydrofolate cyclohydrolase